MRDAEHVEHVQGHPGVAGRAEVHAVVVPVAPVAELAHPPEVHDRGAVTVGRPPDQLGVEREPSAQRPVDRRTTRVEGREHQQPRPGGRQLAEGGVVPVHQCVDVDPRPHDVVGAGVDGEQVGLERDRRLDLLGDHGVELATADRQVGVAELRRLLREHGRDPVGPAAQTVG